MKRHVSLLHLCSLFYLELGIHGLLGRHVFSLLSRVHSLADAAVGFVFLLFLTIFLFLYPVLKSLR